MCQRSCCIVLASAAAAFAQLGAPPATSPDDAWSAEVQLCTSDVPRCRPRVVIHGTSNHPQRGKEIPLPGLCGHSIWLKWIDNRVVAVTCQINPSVGIYQEVDVITGKIMNEALGINFTRSPDGRHVANTGWLPHFGMPYEQSYHLQIDGKDVYPKPTHPDQELNLARKVANRYIEIHDFQSGFAWSPDSRLVALVDLVFDWEPRTDRVNGDDDENRLNPRFYLVVAGVNAIPRGVRIKRSAAPPELHWIGNSAIELVDPPDQKTYRIADLLPVSQVRKPTGNHLQRR